MQSSPLSALFRVVTLLALATLVPAPVLWAQDARLPMNTAISTTHEISIGGDRSGHMIYLRAEDIITSNQDIRGFMDWSLEATRQGPARHDP